MCGTFATTWSEKPALPFRFAAGSVALCLFSGAGFGADHALLALGRHLANECASCHAPRSSGTRASIPQLAGKPEAELIAAMREYQTGKRTNTTMASVAQSLSDSEIAALANYFSSLPVESSGGR